MNKKPALPSNPITVGELIEMLKRVPPDALFYVCNGEDCYPGFVTAFNGDNSSGDSGVEVVYARINHSRAGDHRNYPEPYAGVTPFPLR